MNTGRFDPKVGAKLSIAAVTGAIAANTDPSFAGQPAIWDGTIVGPGNGDQAILTLNGVNYQVEKTPATSANDMAAALVTVCNTTGTTDKWKVTIAGGPAVGGESSSLTIGGNTYNYVAGAGNTATQVATGLQAAAAGDPLYTVTRFNAILTITKNAAGTGVTVSCATDDIVFTHTTVHTITGAPAQADWVVANPGAPSAAVRATCATIGVTADTAASSGTGACVFNIVETQPGLDPFEAWRGDSLAGAKSATGSVECLLNAGVSYDLQIWTRDAATPPVWTQDVGFGTKTINGNATHAFTVSGVRVYAFVDTFVGGADATVVIGTPN